MSPEVQCADSTPKSSLKTSLLAPRIFDIMEDFTAFQITAQFSFEAEPVSSLDFLPCWQERSGL